MRKLRKSLVFILLLLAVNSRAQNSEIIKNYITTFKELAIAEMQRTGVPASIKLAQGIYETTAGTSPLVLQSNNHFGIKCKSTWTGESVRHDDDLKGECFRKYPTAEDSYKDHSDFLKNGQRYAFLFSMDPTNYAAWAYGLKKAGYATSPRYPQALIKIIEDYNLQDYTLIALGKKERTDNIITAVVTDKENISGKEVIPDVTGYPEGEFRINDTKVVYARSGMAFLSLAKKYDVDLSKIFEYNEIPRAEMLEKDQLVYLQKKNKTGSNETHVVMTGETLHDIAQAEGIRMESLLELNLLKPGEMPAVGETLNLKKKAVSMPKLAGRDNYSTISGPQTKTN